MKVTSNYHYTLLVAYKLQELEKYLYLFSFPASSTLQRENKRKINKQINKLTFGDFLCKFKDDRYLRKYADESPPPAKPIYPKKKKKNPDPKFEEVVVGV